MILTQGYAEEGAGGSIPARAAAAVVAASSTRQAPSRAQQLSQMPPEDLLFLLIMSARRSPTPSPSPLTSWIGGMINCKSLDLSSIIK